MSQTLPLLQWDTRLTDRGVQVHPTPVDAGRVYWRLVKAQWLDTPEARGFGPDHHILIDTLDEQGRRAVGISFAVTWPSGAHRITTKGNNGYLWAADYPMSPSLNEFAVVAVDALPADRVTGLGMGKDGNPGEHTSTLLIFQRTMAGAVELPPDPPTPPATDPVLAALLAARQALAVAAERIAVAEQLYRQIDR